MAMEKIWTQIRSPFVLPTLLCGKMKHQSHLWEVFDFGCAGCLICGHVHVCVCNAADISTAASSACLLQLNDENETICTITGLCVRTVTYSEREYVATVHFDEIVPVKSKAHVGTKLPSAVTDCVKKRVIKKRKKFRYPLNVQLPSSNPSTGYLHESYVEMHTIQVTAVCVCSLFTNEQRHTHVVC